MKYLEFATELMKFPSRTVFRTDLKTLHTALITALTRQGHDIGSIPDISDASIVNNDLVTEAIHDLVTYNLSYYAQGRGPFESIIDKFMLGKIDIDVSPYSATPRDVAIDITLVHVPKLDNHDTFIEMQAALTSEQAHRAHM